MVEWSATQVVERAGITYRQLDYWIRAGAIAEDQADLGSGGRRRFTTEEAAAVIVIGGLSTDLRDRGINVDTSMIREMWQALLVHGRWELEQITRVGCLLRIEAELEVAVDMLLSDPEAQP